MFNNICLFLHNSKVNQNNFDCVFKVRLCYFDTCILFDNESLSNYSWRLTRVIVVLLMAGRKMKVICEHHVTNIH